MVLVIQLEPVGRRQAGHHVGYQNNCTVMLYDNCTVMIFSPTILQKKKGRKEGKKEEKKDHIESIICKFNLDTYFTY